MVTFKREHALLGAAMAVSAVLTPRLATADDTSARLSRGETVTYEQTLETASHHYVGGVTYTIVDASSSELATLLEDVRAYRDILPRTKSARLIGMNGGVNGGEFWVELRQGNELVETSYTIVVRRDPDGRTVRFWLDPTKPHGIADAWGYFRVEPLAPRPDGEPRALLTYGALVDLGPGIMRDLFEARLCALMLSVPVLVEKYATTHLRTRKRA
jgi:hypothetical protein